MFSNSSRRKIPKEFKDRIKAVNDEYLSGIVAKYHEKRTENPINRAKNLAAKTKNTLNKSGNKPKNKKKRLYF